MTDTGRTAQRGRETRGADPRDIFVPVDHDLDPRALLEGRGEAIEPGLSIIDTDVPIAGLGAVDLVAIDASRRLVLIDLAGHDDEGEAGRALAHATWFRDNLPVARRMYQLWNVRWDAPIRALWISGGVGGARSPMVAPGAETGFVLEHLMAIPIRTRDGREAVFLADASAASAAAATADAGPSRDAAIDPAAPVARVARDASVERVAGPALAAQTAPRPGPLPSVRRSPLVEIEVAATPGPRRAPRGAGTRSIEEDEEIEVGAQVEGVPSRGEAYRRELGLTSEEFAEFFVGPRTAARPAQGGGVRWR